MLSERVGLSLIDRGLISHIAPLSPESYASAGRVHVFTGAAAIAMITVLMATVSSPARPSPLNGRAGGCGG